ncbi:probable serine/threonine-protein kinase PBL21 isoform X4 [Phragmites australis]|nr:probable serine/threonine-protein kinase PBL21 isoform X3 [Phragmites australis]XP_062182569.1 probable serine/threonine-protein kinase PBL21 isoform X4 [Phragmites australis]
MALWNGVGQVASIAQLAGVDAYGLISMIVEAAQTVKRNRETCQLLARRTRMIGALLQQLERTQLMQHTETRIPVEQLEETLRHAYMLIASCREGSYLHSCFMGGKQAEQLCEVQNEITFYLQLFPLVSFVDTTRTWERLLNRDSPLCTEPSEHAIHNSDYNNRLRTKDLKVTIFEDSGTHPHRESEEKKTEGQVMDMGELANLIGGGKGAELSYFCFSQILAATDNLSERNLIGIGAFGYVYKGKLPNCLDFAVKRHDASSFRGPDMFRTEIEVIPNLQHKNIISLLGYCVQGGEKMLVYEYMPNKSLASIIAGKFSLRLKLLSFFSCSLFSEYTLNDLCCKCMDVFLVDETKRKLLNWSKRLQIIKAIADGLAYLHGRSQICIVHRDIKPSNILLDHEMNAKISDFGLALQLAPNTTAEVLVCGT